MNYYQLYVTSFITREVSFKAMNIWNRIRETSLRSSILLRISSYFACSSFLSSFAFVTSSTALQSCWQSTSFLSVSPDAIRNEFSKFQLNVDIFAFKFKSLSRIPSNSCVDGNKLRKSISFSYMIALLRSNLEFGIKDGAAQTKVAF